MASFGSLRTEQGLAAFDEYLASRSYIHGGGLTQADLDCFAQVSPDPALKHVCRWHGHVKALRRRFPLRAWPAGPAGVSGVAAAAKGAPADKGKKAPKDPAPKGPAPAAAAPGKKAPAKGAGKELVVDVKTIPCSDTKGPMKDPPSLGAFEKAFPRKQCKGQFYITTAINYTNGWPHIGHAYEGVVTDIIARFHRTLGEDTFYQTGTDEHGQKIAQTAEKDNMTPQQLCDMYVGGFKCLNQRLTIASDKFIRTTDEAHMAVAQDLWRKCEASGDIYLDRYEGWYMVREERFVTDTEAQEWNFVDPVSNVKLMRMEEPSYFFRLSKYNDFLVKLLERPDFLQPEQHRMEVLTRLKKEPLRDLSISRTNFEWGVPCPVEPQKGADGRMQKHVMYVWFDALTNYYSGVHGNEAKHPLSRFWPADVHVIGKDIMWFHTVIWPAMLTSAGVPIPKGVWVHGFVAGPDGRKMSKSLGNVVNPHEVLNECSGDTLRWYLIREAGFGDDLKFSVPALQLMHNADLCDTLGNLVNRAVKLCDSSYGGKIPDAKPTGTFPFSVAKLRQEVTRAFNAIETNRAAEAIMRAASDTNRWLTELEPWKMKAAEQHQQKKEVLRVLVEAIYVLAHFYAPFIPQAAAAMVKKFSMPFVPIGQLKEFHNLPEGCPVTSGSVLFEPFADVEVPVKAPAKPPAKPAPSADPNQPLFSKIDIRVGKIEKVHPHPEADRLYVEQINIGTETRTIVSGLRDFYTEDELTGRLVMVVTNMKPKKMKGVESAGMVLCAKTPDGQSIELVDPPKGAAVGTRACLPGDEKFPPAEPQVVQKQKLWEAVAPDFQTNAQREVCFKGAAVVAGGKKLLAPKLSNQPVC